MIAGREAMVKLLLAVVWDILLLTCKSEAERMQLKAA